MKKVLIIDEKVFSSICSAILELEGLKAEVCNMSSEYLSLFNLKDFGLIIMSYPISYPVINDVKNSNLPVILLTDHINREVINLLEKIPFSHCMVKPIDYQKFRLLVREIMNEKENFNTEKYIYNIF